MELVPFTSCGEFQAGMTYAEVKTQFPDHDEFRKSEFPRHVISIVMNETVHVYYTEAGLCEGIEIMKPAFPEWEGIRLGNRGALGLMAELSARNIGCLEDTYGIECKKLGFATYSPHHIMGEDTLIDAVYITFTKDFFETVH